MRNNVGKAIACIVWPRNERLLMTLQIKRMRLKRGQETPFHRLLWWVFLFSFPSKFYHIYFCLVSRN
uniref:Uncharacterized protein n=1 Tax=Salix viminalis TaxID=40686 RepID=A0A6N2L957_SALVM